MGKKLLQVLGGALLIFLLTNLVFPDFFHNRIFAGLSPDFAAVDHLYLQLESEAERGLVDQLHADLPGSLMNFDQKGMVFSSAAKKAARQIRFAEFSPERAQPGSRVAKVTILPVNEAGQYPVCLEFFEVGSEQKLVAIGNAAGVNIVPGSNDAETAKKIAKLLALAY